MAGKLELLSGPTVESTLKDSDAVVYRYEVNKAGLYMAVGIGLIFFALGGVTYWQTQLSEPIWTIAFVVLMLVGLGFTTVAAYWHQFANQNVVGVSAGHLFVGGPKALWAISWELLDKRSAGFEQMQMTRLRGSLDMNVGGQPIKLHLFNVIAFLSDIEGLMYGILSHLNVPEGAEGAGEEE